MVYGQGPMVATALACCCGVAALMWTIEALYACTRGYRLRVRGLSVQLYPLVQLYVSPHPGGVQTIQYPPTSSCPQPSPTHTLSSHLTRERVTGSIARTKLL